MICQANHTQVQVRTLIFADPKEKNLHFLRGQRPDFEGVR
jgi:hypothetical protein